jgi:hypothetical protein
MRFLVIVAALIAVSFAHAQNEVVSAGYVSPIYPTVASGQVTTLFVRGLNVSDAAATGIPLPTTLSGVVVKVTTSIPNYPDRLPIVSVRSYDFCAQRVSVPCPFTHVTVQIPTEPTCVPTGQLPNECTQGTAVIVLNVEQNGVTGQNFPVIVASQNPHIITACDPIFGGPGGYCTPYVTHADGSIVGVDCNNPVKPGETVVLYMVGVGPTNPSVKAGEAAPSSPPAKAVLGLPLILSFLVDLPPASPAPPEVRSPVGGWVNPDYVGLVSGYAGLYQANVKVFSPSSSNLNSAGYTSMRIAIGAGSFGPADGTTYADVCVQVQ